MSIEVALAATLSSAADDFCTLDGHLSRNTHGAHH
jgi:hypothetical protein